MTLSASTDFTQSALPFHSVIQRENLMEFWTFPHISRSNKGHYFLHNGKYATFLDWYLPNMNYAPEILIIDEQVRCWKLTKNVTGMVLPLNTRNIIKVITQPLSRNFSTWSNNRTLHRYNYDIPDILGYPLTSAIRNDTKQVILWTSKPTIMQCIIILWNEMLFFLENYPDNEMIFKLKLLSICQTKFSEIPCWICIWV